MIISGKFLPDATRSGRFDGDVSVPPAQAGGPAGPRDDSAGSLIGNSGAAKDLPPAGRGAITAGESPPPASPSGAGGSPQPEAISDAESIIPTEDNASSTTSTSSES
eukprot:9046684-Heterocapsa_arctica.AAC.1